MCGSIEAKTTYDNYEILILDNGSERIEMINLLESLSNKYRVKRRLQMDLISQNWLILERLRQVAIL